jgi:hypothetical protein
MTLALNESKMGTPADVGHVPRLIRLNHDIWYLIIQNVRSPTDLGKDDEEDATNRRGVA